MSISIVSWFWHAEDRAKRMARTFLGPGFYPAIKDGRGYDRSRSSQINWANTIDQPPFEAYQSRAE